MKGEDYEMPEKLNELLINSSFETGTLPPWTSTPPQSAIVSNAAKQHSGNYIVEIPLSSSIQQVISSYVRSGRTYRLTGALASSGVVNNPTTTVSLQFTDYNGSVLQTFSKTFLNLTLPDVTTGNYRTFSILAESPPNSRGAIVSIHTGAEANTAKIIADDFSLVQENYD